MVSQSKIWNKLYLSNLKWHHETQIPNVLKGKKVLEIGVGTGKTMQSLIKQNPKELIAIDNSKEAVKVSTERIKDHRIKIINADVTDMPFKDNRFDIIVCYYVLNNMLKKDRIKAVKEITRVLGDKGTILFEDFAVGDFRQEAEKLKDIEKNTIKKKNGLICHFFDKKEIKELFKGHKITVKTKEFKPFRALNKRRKIISAIIRC